MYTDEHITYKDGYKIIDVLRKSKDCWMTAEEVNKLVNEALVLSQLLPVKLQTVKEELRRLSVFHPNIKRHKIKSRTVYCYST